MGKLSVRGHRWSVRLGVVVPAVALVAALQVAVNDGAPARATPSAPPYEAPVVVDTNPAPKVVETTLIADETTVDIGNGVKAEAFTYNGAVPGPEFRLTVGDTVIVHLENRLETSKTSIHWHGIELTNASDGTPVTQDTVAPGRFFRYEFQVTRPGIYWYHPHFEGSTNQVFRGLEGAIYVADAQGDEAKLVADGVLPPTNQTKTLLLGDTTVCKSPGSNDATTYPNDPNLPWAGGPPGSYVNPGPPYPVQLCETGPVDDMGDRRPQGGYAAGEIPNIWGRGLANAPEGQTVLTDGRNVGARAGTPETPGALAPNASVFALAPGSGVRLRLINGAHSRYFRLRLTDNAGTQIPLVRVGGEGGLLDRAILEGGKPGGFDTKFAVGEVVLGPSERADVVAVIPATATGVATLWTLDYRRLASGFSRVPTVPVMHLAVTGPPVAPAYTLQGSHPDTPSVPGTPLLASPTINRPVESLGATTGSLLDPATFSPPRPGSTDPRMRMTSATAADLSNPWGFDNVPGPHDTAGYVEAPRISTTRYGRVGDIIDLSVENATTTHHPYHFHGFSFQPLRLKRTDGSSPDYVYPYKEFVDVVDIPPGYTLQFRLRVEERKLQDGKTSGGAAGRWMFHCHIFPHQTGGLMSEFIAVKPDGNERPTIDTATTSVAVDIGQQASVTGRFSDPERSAVVLRSSVGVVADNGNGTWTWTYTAQDRAAESQAVYITARDAKGAEAQADFDLVVSQSLGYRMVAADGGIFSYGARAFQGSTGGLTLNQPIVGGTTNPVGFIGYWALAADGGVFAFNTPFYGSLGGQALGSRAVAIEATPSGRGYWIALADGRVRAFGDARQVGDLSGRALNKPIVSLATTLTGQGYWLVASDGGIFGFGDAGFFGSTGAQKLNAPIVDLAPTGDGRGYYLTASDGGVFAYGSATFRGSAGGLRLRAPVVAMRFTPGGYWLAAADGGIFTYGAIPFLGSVGGITLNSPVLDLIN